MKTARKKAASQTDSLSIVRGLGTLVFHDTLYLYYQTPHAKGFSLATSIDGFSFKKKKENMAIKTGKFTTVPLDFCTDFSFSSQENIQTVLYMWSKGHVLEKAYSEDGMLWIYEGPVSPFSTQGVLVSEYLFANQQVMYALTKEKNTICVAYSRDGVSWKIEKDNLLSSTDGHMYIGSAVITAQGILLVYHVKKDNQYTSSIALFDSKDPSRLLWQPDKPVWVMPKEWKNASPIGVVLFANQIIAYWQVEEKGIIACVYALYEISDGHLSKDISLQLKRHEKNPLISPRSENSWEAFTTFNPAAVEGGGKIHILYRAQGYDYVSVLGYASSSDGIHIDERLNEPVYSESLQKKYGKSPIAMQYVSGGGFGGCEDPRITKIDNRYYMTYVAFDGCHPPRIALTSLAESDFLHHRWKWEKPVLISRPGVVDKSAVIFPEKINGKYVIMHRVYPNILIDFVDNLDFNGTTFLQGQYSIAPRFDKWDSRKIGAGAPPIKTDAGWLLIYQSVGEKDPGRYKIGAMLLDSNDPTKVLHRSQSPILEPDVHYENNGFKSGVIYPCGAVVKDNTLFVYYGASDSYVCVATAPLNTFLDELQFSRLAQLATPVTERIYV